MSRSSARSFPAIGPGPGIWGNWSRWSASSGTCTITLACGCSVSHILARLERRPDGGGLQVLIVPAVGFGLATAAYIALAAVGFTLQAGVSNIFNFAYGDIMITAAFMRSEERRVGKECR